jgi:hypothetical protein
MGLIDMFKPKEDFTPMGSKAANRTEPFTMGGILQRDPNLSFGQGVQDFKQSFQPTEGFAPLGSAKYQSNLETARAKRIADTKPESTESISDKQKTETQTESLLPDPKLKGKSFMDKLQSGIETIFTMQTKDPERYARMMSGLDLYSRSQTQDLATALLGNNKFNKDQASALLQSNKKAMEMKILEANYNKGLQPESASTSEIEVAKGLVKGKVDKDNVDSIANYIAGDAKVLMQAIPGLTYNQAAVIAFQQAQQSGILKEDNAFFRKKLEFNPDADISKSATLKQLQELNPGLSEEAIRKQAKIEGVTIR